MIDHEQNAQAASSQAKKWAYDGFEARRQYRAMTKAAREAFNRGDHREMQLLARIAESQRQLAKIARTMAQANLDRAIAEGRAWLGRREPTRDEIEKQDVARQWFDRFR